VDLYTSVTHGSRDTTVMIHFKTYGGLKKDEIPVIDIELVMEASD
jgi:hypothetical protein